MFRRSRPSFLKQFMKNFVLRSDMFAAQPTLRYAGQSCYETIFGGIFSILLVIAFAAIFYTSFYNVLTKINVIASNDVEDDPYGTHVISGLEFAVGIDGLDSTASQRYFGIVIEAVTVTNGVTTEVEIQMETCNKTKWVSYSSSFSSLYDDYGMSTMLCPVQAEDIVMKGFEASDVWNTVEIRVEQCSNASASGYTCHAQATIDAFFTSHTNANDFFKVELFVLDTQISPTHEVYLTKILEKQIFVTFSHNIGSRGIVRVGHYEVITDTSIWPYPIYTNQSGHYIESFETHAIDLYSTHYVRVIIEKSRKMFSVSRAHDKFDGMLSYVGGLFALIFGWLYFFIGSFSEYRYELSVAENTFAIDENGKKYREKQFGFFTYLQYAIYDWLRTFNISVNWVKVEQINQIREEATEQMDVRYILKQMQHYSTVNKLLLEQHRLISAHLARHPTLHEVKKMRKISQYYDKVIKDESNLTHNQKKDHQKEEIVKQMAANNQIFNEVSVVYENDSDFDSDDEQAENVIMEAVGEAKKNRDDIVSRIPQQIVTRLSCKEKLMKMKQSGSNGKNAQMLENSELSSVNFVRSRDQTKRQVVVKGKNEENKNKKFSISEDF